MSAGLNDTSGQPPKTSTIPDRRDFREARKLGTLVEEPKCGHERRQAALSSNSTGRHCDGISWDSATCRTARTWRASIAC